MENNPLRQYFRRPSVYIKLPSEGKDYSNGEIDMPANGEIPIYPMTAIDEITARTPDALFNGSAVTELIKSCVPNVIDPWAISSNDLDAILIAIKAAGGTDSLEIDSTCPSCKENSIYGINLIGILSGIKAGDYSEPLTIGDLKFKFKPLRYKDMNEGSLGQFEVQRKFKLIENIEDEDEQTRIRKETLTQVTLLTMNIIAKAIEYIETPNSMVDEFEYIVDFLKHCDKDVYAKIRDHNAKIKKDTELKPLSVKCIHCQHEYEQPFTLNPSDFFG
jgi:hypothetical protein